MKLRWYQQEAVDAVFDNWSSTPGANPLIVAPCGAGKSVILGELIRRCMEFEGTRVLVLTHRQELLVQNEEKLQKLWPMAPTGFFSAGLGQRDWSAPILFAGIQSVWKHLGEMDAFDVVLIDEAHLIPTNEDTMYRRAFSSVREKNPSAVFVGLTATHYRMDSGMLHEGENAMFDDICYEIHVQTLVDEGHLVPAIAREGVQTVDTSSVRRNKSGEFNLRQMAEAFDVAGVVEPAVQEFVELGAERRAWVIFCASIKHAEQVVDLLAKQGIGASLITGGTSRDERADTLRAFRAGELRALVNVDVLTTGFDAPICDMLVLLRATKSTSLYVQIIGRVMRTHPGKVNGLVLDYGNNVLEHGPIDRVTVNVEKGAKSEKKEGKTCPSCKTILHVSSTSCPSCGHEFPGRSVTHEVRAGSAALLASLQVPEWVDVHDIDISLHTRGKAPCVRVEYYCADRTVTEFLMPEHGGFPTTKTQIIMKARYGLEMPHTARELVDMMQNLPFPTSIEVERDGKYWRVKTVSRERQAREPVAPGSLGAVLRGMR